MDINKIDFKKIWDNQRVDQTNLDDLVKKIEQLKNSNRKKNIVLSIYLLITLLLMISIWFFLQPNSITSKVGFFLITIAIFFFIFSVNKKHFNSPKNNENENSTNNEYLNYLLNLKEKQKRIQTSVIKNYFLFLNLGILLFMCEFALKMNLLWAIIGYLIIVGWLLIVWLYIRPRIIKKQNNQIEDTIVKLQKLQTQLNNQ